MFIKNQSIDQSINRLGNTSEGHFQVPKSLTFKMRLKLMQNLSCENKFYLHDNKARFHINAFALTGLQITVGYPTLADQNLLV